MQGRFRILTSAVMICLAWAVLAAAAVPAAADSDTGSATAGDLNATGSPGTNASVLPGNPLYGLKLTFERMDESFTFNSSERLEKQLDHADSRLSEAKTAFLRNSSADAEEALSGYYEETNATANTLAALPPGSAELRNASTAMENHQYEIERMMQMNPDSPGLQQAYRNNLGIRERVQERSDFGNETPNQSAGGWQLGGNTTLPAGQPGLNQGQSPDTGNLPQGQENRTPSQVPVIGKSGTGTGNNSADGRQVIPGRQVTGTDTADTGDTAGQIRSPSENRNLQNTQSDNSSRKSAPGQSSGQKTGNGR